MWNVDVQAEMLADMPLYKRVRRELLDEIYDNDMPLFLNFRSITLKDWENLNCATGSFEPCADIAADDDYDDDDHWASRENKRKIPAPRSYHYIIGDYYTSTFYMKFLSDSVVQVPGEADATVRNITRRQSLNSKSTFWSWFRIPLYKVEEICEIILLAEILTLSQHCRSESQLKTKCELLVLASLAYLGGTFTQFRQIPTLTNICATEHSEFFKKFVQFLYDIRSDYIYLPRNQDELLPVMKRYEEVGLPGCMGSVDVVHVKWSNCPAGDFNRAKGKESYPSLAFECISDYDRRIISVYGPQFGSRNDKHIVKDDSNVLAVGGDWYKTIQWTYFNDDGEISSETGAYLICDNGYLQWPTLMCPFMRSETNGPYETCYSANFESVRKDVECVFGILKGRFGYLATGFLHRQIAVCENVFVACCVLHNMMLDEMKREQSPERLGRGCRMPDGGMWLSGPTEQPHDEGPNTSRIIKLMRNEFHRRRNLLAKHIWWWNVKCKNGELTSTIN